MEHNENLMKLDSFLVSRIVDSRRKAPRLERLGLRGLV